MKSEFCLERSWRQEMSTRETGKEVVERDFVHQIDDGEFCAERMSVLLPQGVGTECNVENVAGCDARRVGVRIVSSRSGNANENSSKVR